jgi:hypothetical protein
MNRDYGEDVGSEETRSIESEDLRKDDVSDLLDETEEVRRPKEPGQLENPRSLSTDTGSVPPLKLALAKKNKKNKKNDFIMIYSVGTKQAVCGL